MKIKVLFFGATADAAGSRSMDFDLEPGTTADDAFKSVLSSNPKLASHKLLFAVNQAYSSGEEVVNEGDELAIFTAVSGG